MKKTVYSSLAVAILALGACAKVEQEAPVEVRSHKIIATIDDTGTKTAYAEDADKAVMSWVAADEIKLVVYGATDGTKAANFYRYRAQADGSSVEFGCVDSGGNPTSPNFTKYPRAGVAVYPSDLTIGGNYGAYTVTLPASYSVSGADLSRVMVPLMGTTTPDDGDHYTFKHAVGVLKVTLANVPAEAGKLVVTAPDSDNLSGVFPLSVTEGLKMSECSGSAGHSITIDFDRLAAGSVLDVYVPVPVGTLSTGTSFDVQRPDGTSLKKLTTNKAIAIQRGHLTPLAVIPIGSQAEIPLDDSMISVNVDAGTKDGSSHYDGSGKAALVDGDLGTFWHTPWQALGESYYNWSDLDATYGAYIDIDLGEGKTVTTFDIHAALRNPAGSDWPKHMVVYSSADGSSWNKVGETADANASAGEGYWIAPIECSGSAARYIRISILTNSADGELLPTSNACTHLAEIKLYGTLYEGGVASTWLNLFTDHSYSELKAGVTEADILAMYNIAPYYLAENVAMPLLCGTYDGAFRIGTYQPYSDNRIAPANFYCRVYSALDNPTGIQVSAGDEIVVCVDQIPAGQTVSLAVYGDDASGYLPNFGNSSDPDGQEGYDQNVELHAGVNEISITADGMVYVLNTITETVTPYRGVLNPTKKTIASCQPVKVHFLPGSGTVQGYFDPTLHSDAEGQAILDANTYKYFMLKGERLSFLFHTQILKDRGYTIAQLHTGLDAWNEAVTQQQELIGMDRSWFNNHILAVTTTSLDGADYMNANHRRVLFGARENASADALHMIYSRQALIDNEGGWGPFHELGHLHQNAINWKSTTESSNNLFSNYCKMRLAGDNYYNTVFSRGAKIKDLADSYAEAKPWVLLGDADYLSEDTELHMRMNWQLWNYYHKCGHKTNFWPKLFEYLRQHPLHSDYANYYHGYGPENPGLAQLEFYEACCDVAQEDLTDFFDAWGFFRTVNIPDYYQYAYINYQVMQEMIDEFKARVTAKGYPKAAPIQYLEDRTQVGDVYYSQLGYYTQFIGEAATISASAAALITTENTAFFFYEDNAVAVELRAGNTADGALLYFTNMHSMVLPSGLSFSGNSLWAVQADGTRVKLTILE